MSDLLQLSETKKERNNGFPSFLLAGVNLCDFMVPKIIMNRVFITSLKRVFEIDAELNKWICHNVCSMGNRVRFQTNKK